MLIFIAKAQREYKKDTLDTSWYWDPKTLHCTRNCLGEAPGSQNNPCFIGDWKIYPLLYSSPVSKKPTRNVLWSSVSWKPNSKGTWKLMLGIQSLPFGSWHLFKCNVRCLCKTQLWNVTTWFLPCQKGQGHLCCKPQDTGVVSSAYSNVTLQHSDLAKRKFNCLVVSCETELVTKLQIAVPQCCLSFSKSSPV